MSTRILQKSRERSRNEATELLQLFFAAELLCPSKTLWIVSPWLRNIELFDGTTGAFSDLFPDAPRRMIRLTDVLRSLLVAGSRIVLVVRAPRDDGGVGVHLAEVARGLGRASQLSVVDHPNVHSKGLLGDHAAVTGSMNVTHAGVGSHTELLQFITDNDTLAKLRLPFSGAYGR